MSALHFDILIHGGRNVLKLPIEGKRKLPRVASSRARTGEPNPLVSYGESLNVTESMISLPSNRRSAWMSCTHLRAILTSRSPTRGLKSSAKPIPAASPRKLPRFEVIKHIAVVAANLFVPVTRQADRKPVRKVLRQEKIDVKLVTRAIFSRLVPRIE
jgi:hypothetical protein